MFQNSKTMLYFAPHQDDELLTLGIDISISITKGHDVHIILCTDGSKSCVRKILNNQKSCAKHEGTHNYDLSIEDFIIARDKEFLDSCYALGVIPSNIHILENRYTDGTLTVANAESIIKTFLSDYGDDSIVCTIGSNNGSTQHSDHKALGKAAENLFAKGIIKELKLFIEPYLSKKVLSNPRALPIYPTTQKAPVSIKKNIKNAISSYSCWNPTEQRYAIGYHSVTTEFSDFLKDMTSYYYLQKNRSAMTITDKLAVNYKRWKKIQKHQQLYYSIATCEQPDLGEFKVVEIRTHSIYKAFCQQYNLTLREKDLQRLSDGSSFWGLVTKDNLLLSSGWLAYKQYFYIGETDFGFDMKHSHSGILYDFNTKPEYRGHGYYGLLLKSIVHQAKGPTNFIIYTSPDNFSSSKGILKAGFIYDGSLSSSNHSMKHYLKKHGFTKITRKKQFWRA